MPRSKIILVPTKRIEGVTGELVATQDYRNSGVRFDAVEQQDTTRENEVKKLIEKDLSQKINKFSKESQDLLADLNNTEIFELCENSSKQQCLECNTYWEI